MMFMRHHLQGLHRFKRHYPLHLHISTLFVVLILLVGGLIGALGYRYSTRIVEATASNLTDRIGRETLSQLTDLVAPGEIATSLLRHDSLLQAGTLDQRLARLPYLREALDSSSAVTAMYVGYRNGDFFFLRRLPTQAERAAFGAPPGAVYLLQSIDRPQGQARGRYLYLDAALHILKTQERPDYTSFDPRSRDWWRLAMVSPRQIKTPPYLFFSSGQVGLTIATAAPGGDGVVGADILLETVAQSLARQKLTPGSHLAVVNPQGMVVAYENAARMVRQANAPEGRAALARLEQLGVPVFTQMAALLKDVGPGQSRLARLQVGDDHWRASITPVQLKGARPLHMLIAVPEHELLAASHELVRRSAYLTGLIILLAIPVTWLIARGIAGPIRALAKEAEAIAHFEFTQPIRVDSIVLETHELAVAMDSMKRTIRRFRDVSMAVAAEGRLEHLLPLLLSETLSAADAAGGVLYLVDASETDLRRAVALRADGQALEHAPRVLHFSGGEPWLSQGGVGERGHACSLAPADVQALGLTRALAECRGTHAIGLPLFNQQGALLAFMVMLRDKDIEASQLSFIEALSGPAALSLENKELIKAQKALFEAFIQLIASAIDAKSPYTGGHCARVPELTKMLARAACEATDGPYKDFRLDESEWEAVHVAAWLHDCGKVTTPEYVVDKATKLETLYDRIHEVRMRFEVLKRDAEIRCLQAVAAGADPAGARACLVQELARLDEDYAFVASCNEGGEFMAPDKVERLRRIAARTWLRTLDDRIGISHEEKARKDREPAPALPVAEPLLADRAEHLFERRPQDRIAPDNRWGFKMAVPDLLYNKGELYNLSVARGTLTEEERYKINEHMVQTIIMLSQLPYPKHLRQVPEIAGGHHEKMDGTGYPKRLVREQMSPVARMMAIADIFEALTAVDRPYKKGKTLTETIRIMSFMKKDQHIDGELFDLFLKSGVYLDYARRFMKPDQIDEVDVDAFVTPAPKTSATSAVAA